MAQRLCGVTGTLGMCDELTYLLCVCRAGYGEGDCHVLEIRRCVIDIILFGVMKARSNVRRSVINGYVVEWREPRQLSKESEGDTNHKVLQG